MQLVSGLSCGIDLIFPETLQTLSTATAERTGRGLHPLIMCIISGFADMRASRIYRPLKNALTRAIIHPARGTGCTRAPGLTAAGTEGYLTALWLP